MKRILATFCFAIIGTLAIGESFDHTASGSPRGNGSNDDRVAASAAGVKDCNSCNDTLGFQKSTHVELMGAEAVQSVLKYDCTKIEYKWEDYTEWIPQEYWGTETYTQKVKVPYTETKTRKATGYTKEYGSYKKTGYNIVTKTGTKTVPYTTRVCKEYIDECGCKQVRWVNVTNYKTVNYNYNVAQPYSYDQPYSYNKPYTYDQPYDVTKYRTEDRVRTRQVKKIKMVEVPRRRQVPVVKIDAKYRQKTEHFAVYKVTTRFGTDLPKDQGERLYQEQQERIRKQQAEYERQQQNNK